MEYVLGILIGIGFVIGIELVGKKNEKRKQEEVEKKIKTNKRRTNSNQNQKEIKKRN